MKIHSASFIVNLSKGLRFDTGGYLLFLKDIRKFSVFIDRKKYGVSSKRNPNYYSGAPMGLKIRIGFLYK